MWPLHYWCFEQENMQEQWAHEPHVCIKINEWIWICFFNVMSVEHCGLFNLCWKVCQFVSPVCPAVSREVIVWQVANWSLQHLSWASLTLSPAASAQNTLQRIWRWRAVSVSWRKWSLTEMTMHQFISEKCQLKIFLWSVKGSSNKTSCYRSQYLVHACSAARRSGKLEDFSEFEARWMKVMTNIYVSISEQHNYVVPCSNVSIGDPVSLCGLMKCNLFRSPQSLELYKNEQMSRSETWNWNWNFKSM